jgi:hypothetical protein
MLLVGFSFRLPRSMMISHLRKGGTSDCKVLLDLYGNCEF